MRNNALIGRVDSSDTAASTVNRRWRSDRSRGKATQCTSLHLLVKRGGRNPRDAFVPSSSAVADSLHPKDSMKTAIATLCGVVTAVSALAADVSGQWELAAQLLNDVNHARMTFAVTGEKLTGTLNELTLEGTVKGDEVAFVATRPNGDRFGAFKGRVKDNDSREVRRSLGGNPQTGPFYVEGAFPGDTLVVKLNRVRLNRDSAISSGRIASTALNPAYVERTRYQPDFDSNWVLDREKGIARLKNPSEHLKNYTVKLQPMVGCLAVAPPAHQAFRTGYPGTFGGNMDYNQIREGTTVYLPVSVPGALLSIGDGHAAQGDGELTGNALETSLDVEFTVDVISGRASNGPRAENSDYLMSSGIGNALTDALQQATTQLVNWLQSDYALRPTKPPWFWARQCSTTLLKWWTHSC